MSPLKSLSLVLALAAICSAVPAKAQQGPLPVTVAPPLVKKIVDWDEYTGRFEAVQRVDIRARVSGFLESVHFKDGQLVEKGQLLFVIDPRPFEARLAAANAGLEAARTRVRLAEREFARAQELVKRSTISKETFDQRNAELATAKTAVLGAQAEVRFAELQLSFTRVLAPFAGRVSDARVDIGNLVEGGSAQSTLLTTVIALDPILFTFSASEAEFLKYSRLHFTGQRESSRQKENPVWLRLMDEDEFRWQGRMSFVDNELSPQTATIRAQAIFENPAGFFTPGVFGRLRVVGSNEYEAVLVPDAAIVSDQSSKLLLTVDAEGNVSGKLVELGPLHNGLRVIRSGLGRQDRVVVKGVQRAKPGGKVLPRNAEINPDGSLTLLDGS